MSPLARRLCSLVPIAAMASCDINDGGFDPDEEFNAGGADPYKYPAAYRGERAIRERPGSAVFTEVGAFSKGKPVGYYMFPFSPSQVSTTAYPPPSGQAWPDGVVDPLRLSGPGTDPRSVRSAVPVGAVYNFDPPGGGEPFAPAARCASPPGYVQDRRWEGVPANEQWNVFTLPPDRFTQIPFGALPTWTYRPIVAEVPVTTRDLECQAVKSERTLLARADAGAVDVPRGEPEQDRNLGRLGKPTEGRFLAWALIDPGAAVVRVGERPNVIQGGTVSGTSVQKYGWLGQFIVAYIDGGYIPVDDGPRIGGAPTTRVRPQRLYYPRSDVIVGRAPRPGQMGAGYDVVQGDRFENGGEGYSPVCEVWTYAIRPTPVESLPKSEEEILALANSTLEPARTCQPGVPGCGTSVPSGYLSNTAIVPKYVFCLQAAPRVVSQ